MQHISRPTQASASSTRSGRSSISYATFGTQTSFTCMASSGRQSRTRCRMGGDLRSSRSRYHGQRCTTLSRTSENSSHHAPFLTSSRLPLPWIFCMVSKSCIAVSSSCAYHSQRCLISQNAYSALSPKHVHVGRSESGELLVKLSAASWYQGLLDINRSNRYLDSEPEGLPDGWYVKRSMCLTCTCSNVYLGDHQFPQLIRLQSTRV